MGAVPALCRNAPKGVEPPHRPHGTQQFFGCFNAWRVVTSGGGVNVGKTMCQALAQGCMGRPLSGG